MVENKIWYLKQVDLFKGIEDTEIMTIAKKVKEKECKKKEVLYTPFEVSDSIYLLKKGEVTLYHLHKGKKLIINILNPGSIFGSISLNSQKSSHFAEVTASAYICIFKLGEFLEIIKAKPEIMLRLLQMSSERIADYEYKLKDHLYDAKEKLLNQLNLLDKEKRTFFDILTGRSTKITHEILSQRTGLSRETVTRSIRELKKEGKIEMTNDGLFLLK